MIISKTSGSSGSFEHTKTWKRNKLIEDLTKVLAVPLPQDATQFTSTNIQGEILGIITINYYFIHFRMQQLPLKTKT